MPSPPRAVLRGGRDGPQRQRDWCSSTAGPTGASNVATYTCTIVGAVAGTYSATATYPGDSNYSSASGTDSSATVVGCTAYYTTNVVVHASTTWSAPDLFTDTVLFSWCRLANGKDQILGAGQLPAVQTGGTVLPAAEAGGLTFGFTPAVASEPIINHATNTATAVGTSFNETFDYSDIASAVILAAVGGQEDRLAAELLTTLRETKATTVITKAILKDYGQYKAFFVSLLSGGVVGRFLTDHLIIDQVTSYLQDDANQFVSSVLAPLVAWVATPRWRKSKAS